MAVHYRVGHFSKNNGYYSWVHFAVDTRTEEIYVLAEDVRNWYGDRGNWRTTHIWNDETNFVDDDYGNVYFKGLNSVYNYAIAFGDLSMDHHFIRPMHNFIATNGIEAIVDTFDRWVPQERRAPHGFA